MDIDILIKYLEGSLDKTNTELVDEWIQASLDNRKVVEQLYELLFINDRIVALEEYDVDKSYSAFKEAIKPNIAKTKSKTYPLLKRIASVAAIAILFLIIGTIATIGVLDSAEDTIQINTHLGERAQVNLPDGSKVWLNACSSIEYKKSLLTRKRVANIEGEGYFEVAHNNMLPFIVKNNTSEIRVLGTKFNVRSNDDDEELVVSLFEGSVSFSDISGAYAKLIPGESAIYNKSNHELNVERDRSEYDATAWMDGNLVFKNTSLLDISKSLERHYNINISFADKDVMTKRFTAEFGVSDNIYQILSILELTKTFKYEIKDREVIIESIR